MKPFDYINDINYGKKNVIENSDNPELAEKLYVPYVTNKTLSYFIDFNFIIRQSYSNRVAFLFVNVLLLPNSN